MNENSGEMMIFWNNLKEVLLLVSPWHRENTQPGSRLVERRRGYFGGRSSRNSLSITCPIPMHVATQLIEIGIL